MTEQELIAHAHHICKTGFMDYPDYDEQQEITLADAIVICVSETIPHDMDFDQAQLFDMIDSRI